MLNDELKRLRKQRQLTQEKLAEAFGVSQSTITSWENGTRKPTTDFIPTIAEFFGVSSDSLLGMIDNDKSPNAEEPRTPKTVEAKIVSFGMDQLPQEERQKIISVLQAMYINNPGLFKQGGNNEA